MSEVALSHFADAQFLEVEKGDGGLLARRQPPDLAPNELHIAGDAVPGSRHLHLNLRSQSRIEPSSSPDAADRPGAAAGGDPIGPGRKGGRVLEAGEAADDLHPRLLDGILRHRLVAEQPPRMNQKLLLPARGEPPEGETVAETRAGDQIFVDPPVHLAAHLRSPLSPKVPSGGRSVQSRMK
jgi:hypothetical protein